MHQVIVAWTDKNSFGFEANLPLLWSGKRNLKLGSKNKIDILFLSGYQNLGGKYLSSLKNVGYSVYDASRIYDHYSSKYKQLNRFRDYEKKCFLRWLVLKNFYKRAPIIHFDGDIVFNQTPERLAQRLGKYTFILQGCPALASLKNPSWLKAYQKSLNQFAKDIDKYSLQAWNQRQGWKKSFKKKWAGSRYRRIISSDQDLVSHLIHTDQLPQDSPTMIKKANSDMILFENPLYFFGLNKEDKPFKYQRKGIIDYINNKKVAIWHMQTNFSDYLKRYYLLKGKLKMPLRIHNPHALGNKTMDELLYNLLYMFKIPQKILRLDVYKYFFEEKDFSLIFNNQVFWKKAF